MKKQRFIKQLVCGLSTALLLTVALSTSGVNNLTQHGDNNRSGANTNETILTPSNVNSNSFGKLFEQPVAGEIYGQPLYVQGLNVNGASHNVVFVSTDTNVFYAFDGDNGSIGPLWTRTIGSPIPQALVQCCYLDIQYWVGTISTGVIDTNKGVWYVLTMQVDSTGTNCLQYIRALNITNGTDWVAPHQISGSYDGVNFNAALNNQRAGLLLQNGKVYVAWSSHGDGGNYHGFVMSFSATNLSPLNVWADTTVSGGLGGIWMAGGGLIGDGTNIFLVTGNGTFNANTGGTNYGESYVKLSSTLSVLDYFTSADQAGLTGADRDLGGGGAMLIPGTRRIVGGGKDGMFHLVNADSMGGYNSSVDACIQSFMVTDPNAPDGLNHIHGGPCFWNGKIYVGGEDDYLKEFSWNGSTINTNPVSKTPFPALPASMPGWQISVSANGNNNGIVWAQRVYSGDANNALAPGILHAFNATNLNIELWNSYQNVQRDDYGLFAKNPAPIVANGKVYEPSFSDKLVVYGLNPPPPSLNLALNQPAVASSTNDGTVASEAFDGNLNTRWGSAYSDPQWIYVDLGATFSVSKVVLDWEAAYATAYQIQVSTNASNWTTVYSTTSGMGGDETINFTPANARYVRMYGTARATTFGYSLWEFQVYGSSVSFYQDTLYGGAVSKPLAAGNYTEAQLGALNVPNHWASSAAIPDGWTVTMYSADNFTGTSWTLTNNTPDFTVLSPNANDQMSSCTISSGSNVLLSQGHPVTASSVDGTNVAANANDGNTTVSRWAASTGTFPQWWRVDLGASHTLHQVTSDWYNAASRYYQYRIEVSSDDSSYTTVVDKTGNTTMGNTTDNFTATGRYVRVTVTGASAGYASFYECQVSGN